jgi:hypothetical protein
MYSPTPLAGDAGVGRFALRAWERAVAVRGAVAWLIFGNQVGDLVGGDGRSHAR